MDEKKKKKIGWLIFGLFWFFGTLMGLIVTISEGASGENYQSNLMAIIVTFLIGLFCMWMYHLSGKKLTPEQQKKVEIHKQKMQATKKPKQREKELQQQRGYLESGYFKHIYGLPLAEGLSCKIEHYPDKFCFCAVGTEIDLSISKVTDMTLTTNKEIQNQAVSSVGGAVLGGYLAGPLGAMIGGRAKTKKVETVTHLLLMTYVADDEVKYIGFEIPPTGTNKDGVWADEFSKAGKWVDEFKYLGEQREVHKVEL